MTLCINSSIGLTMFRSFLPKVFSVSTQIGTEWKLGTKFLYSLSCGPLGLGQQKPLFSSSSLHTMLPVNERKSQTSVWFCFKMPKTLTWRTPNGPRNVQQERYSVKRQIYIFIDRSFDFKDRGVWFRTLLNDFSGICDLWSLVTWA